MSTQHCAPPEGADEEARLAALRRYEILDTPPEAEFDDLTRMASYICGAPIALISLVDRDRQWFKSEIGLGVSETTLDKSICRHAILGKELFVVPDTTQDRRFNSNPLVTGEEHIRFYAGAVLETNDAQPLGTLCVLDRRPRELTLEQAEALRLLARQVMVTLELRHAIRQLALRNQELETARRAIKTLEGILPICAKCKKIRDEGNRWDTVEHYIATRTEVNFTHSLCPHCADDYLNQLDRLDGEKR
jgi:GAF domain-containing protein